MMGHAIVSAGTLLAIAAVCVADDPHQADRYNVVWETPSTYQTRSYGEGKRYTHRGPGSMPIGNGDIGMNVWAEPDGGVRLLVSKTDTWDEYCRLLKLGRVRIDVLDNAGHPRGEPTCFRQELCLSEGLIRFAIDDVSFRVWIDANNPVIRVEADADAPFRLLARLESWRTEERVIEKGQYRHSARSMFTEKEPLVLSPDHFVDGLSDRIVWYHHNPKVPYSWRDSFVGQGLEAYIADQPDPIVGRTFGAAITGPGFETTDTFTFATPASATSFELSIHPLTLAATTPEAWRSALDQQVSLNEAIERKAAFSAHRDWWRRFWERSWIHVTGDADAERISQAYALQRWVTACAGRGAYPIKFNGSIFNVEDTDRGKRQPDPLPLFDADYRRWGGQYWWQNTRLIYWPLTRSGDVDLMKPLFRMYTDILPMAKWRTQTVYGHEGAYFDETMAFWGIALTPKWNSAPEKPRVPEGGFTGGLYISGLGLLAMALDVYDYERDPVFLRETVLPLADSILAFWANHYGIDERGRLYIYPAHALETYWKTLNPTPDVAGLRWCLEGLLKLDDVDITAARRTRWKAMLATVPELPRRTKTRRERNPETGAHDERQVETLAIAERIEDKDHNKENPECYAIFPFRLYGHAKPNYELGLNTFLTRKNTRTHGWNQNGIQAAYLGLADAAAKILSGCAGAVAESCRFPAMWGPNYDWRPDQTHGGNLMTTLQTMLLQADDGKIHLAPAWPEKWDVHFKLHAPRQTVVEAHVKNGEVNVIEVTPESRAGDTVIEKSPADHRALR